MFTSFQFVCMTLTAGVGATSAGASLSDCGTWPPVTTWPWLRTGGWCCRTGRGPTLSPQHSASEPLRQGCTDTRAETHIKMYVLDSQLYLKVSCHTGSTTCLLIKAPLRRRYKGSPLNLYKSTTPCPWTGKSPFSSRTMKTMRIIGQMKATPKRLI